MSGTASEPSKPGPVLEESVNEVCGAFPTDAALQDAIGRLQQAGFDRADISIPTSGPGTGSPEASAENPVTDDDERQARTLGTSMAATVGAIAAAGAVIATGGAALPAVVAAVAGGVGLGAAAQGLTGVGDTLRHDERAEAAARGELLLSVRTQNAARVAAAEAAMQAAGVSRLLNVRLVSGRTAASPV